MASCTVRDHDSLTKVVYCASNVCNSISKALTATVYYRRMPLRAWQVILETR